VRFEELDLVGVEPDPAGDETLYLRLVGECGWSGQRYVGLLEQMLSPLLA
jgi:hypothetical protein